VSTITCEWCGNPFEPKTADSKYCKKRCSRSAAQARYTAKPANKEKIAARNKAKYDANHQEHLAQRAEYRAARRASDADGLKAYFAEYYQKNKEVRAAGNKARYEANKEARAAAGKARYQKNKEQIAARSRIYRRATREQRNAQHRVRMQTDPLYNITICLRNRLTKVLREARAKKTKSTFGLLGCTIEEFMVYLEAQFQPGMTWDNRSEWHIDHKIPCVSFNLLDPEQQRLCFHYTNLQPLWAKDNLSKWAKADQ
jgi:hypothetical protein